MKQIAPNTYVEIEFSGCNSTFVVTTEGVVLIDTPEIPTDAVKWRDTISRYGPVRYLINTEPHGDHFLGNCFFDGVVVSHEGTREAMLALPIEPIKESFKKREPESEKYLEDFYLRLPSVTFSQNLTLYLGKHSFQLMHLPGHSPYQIAVYIPKERVICSSDNVVYKLQPGLHAALPYEWMNSLKRMEELGENVLVPGHGDVCDSSYIPEMRTIIQDWIDAVTASIEKGMSLEEAQATISFADRYPMEEGHPLTMEEVQRENIERLYKVLS